MTTNVRTQLLEELAAARTNKALAGYDAECAWQTYLTACDLRKDGVEVDLEPLWNNYQTLESVRKEKWNVENELVAQLLRRQPVGVHPPEIAAALDEAKAGMQDDRLNRLGRLLAKAPVNAKATNGFRIAAVALAQQVAAHL